MCVTQLATATCFFATKQSADARLRTHAHVSTCVIKQLYTARFTISEQRLKNFAFAYTAFDSEIAFAILLGPTDPCSIAVSMEPFSTLALKGLT